VGGVVEVMLVFADVTRIWVDEANGNHATGTTSENVLTCGNVLRYIPQNTKTMTL
jgi:hypothetical protein